MEIRAWFNQELVLPADMNGSTSDMYQRNYDTNNFPPMILWGLQLTGLVGNTAAFSIGAARAKDITVANYPFLPTPPYGTGYPGLIEIPQGYNSITLDPLITPCYIVATYDINPTAPGQNLYKTNGKLAQVSSVNGDTQVVIAHANYSSSAWTISQSPWTNRDNDAAGSSAIQYNLNTNRVQLGNPQGKLATGIQVTQNLFDANNYLLNTSKIDVPTTNTPINSLASGSSFVKFTGSIPTTVNGITAGISALGAQQLSIYNGSSANITFVDNSPSAAAPNRILTAGGNISLGAGFMLDFIYDESAQLWIPKKSS